MNDRTQGTRRTDLDPMRDVKRARFRSGQSIGVRNFPIHWWELTLTCGHVVERPAKAKPGVRGQGFAGLHHPPGRDEWQPAQKRARCHECTTYQPLEAHDG